MSVQTAFGTVHSCQIEDCEREAETSQYVNTPRGRGEIATCFPCARAIRVGERSANGNGRHSDRPVEFRSGRDALDERGGRS